MLILKGNAVQKLDQFVHPAAHQLANDTPLRFAHVNGLIQTYMRRSQMAGIINISSQSLIVHFLFCDWEENFRGSTSGNFGYGKFNPEYAAIANEGFDADRAAHQLGKLPGNRQTDTGTFNGIGSFHQMTEWHKD